MALYFRVMNWLQQRRERGQTLTEYAFIILLVAVMLIGALALLKNELELAYSRIVNSLVPPGGG